MPHDRLHEPQRASHRRRKSRIARELLERGKLIRRRFRKRQREQARRVKRPHIPERHGIILIACGEKRAVRRSVERGEFFVGMGEAAQ